MMITLISDRERGLMAEVDALKVDAERLDWLAYNFRTSTVYMSGQHPHRPNHRVMGLAGPTFRAAIDAAMAVQS